MTLSADTPKLLSPIQAGALALKHRIAMGPLTRLRANPETSVPSDWAVDYYTQRASDGGLLVSEGTFIHPELKGYARVPGIWSKEQIAQWKRITDGVHSKNGKFFCQLWVLGRVADPKVIPVVYSAGTVEDLQPSPFKDDSVRKPLVPVTEDDMERIIGYYVQAAKNAVEAGFDGVEIHGANGYFLDQFLQTNSNDRTDAYGGSLENRLRFPLRVLNAVCAAIGAPRVGIRMSPFSEFQSMRMADPLATFVPWAAAIVKAQPELAYVHAVEGRGLTTDESEWYAHDDLNPIRQEVYKTNVKFIVAGGYNSQSAIKHAEEYPNDLVAFGRFFISNPDLPKRVANNWPLSPYDRNTFYAQTAEGYIDYPEYSPEKQAQA